MLPQAGNVRNSVLSLYLHLRSSVLSHSPLLHIFHAPTPLQGEGGWEKFLERKEIIVYLEGLSFCLQVELNISLLLMFAAAFSVSEDSGFLSLKLCAAVNFLVVGSH